MSHKHSDHHVCNCGPSQLTQTLDEMDWERGIWYAALLGNVTRVLELLQKNGARITDNSGYTALHYAARGGHTEICQILLDHGADINAQTRSGKSTPLQRAAAAGKLVTLEFLLQRGADPHILDADGQTALHRAAHFKHVDIMTALVTAAPALADARDKHGNTAHDILFAKHNID